MPDIWLDVDTAVVVPANILPLLDDTDFKSIETAVVYNSAGLAVTWNFVTSAGVQTGTAITPTTGGTYDWAEPIADKGMYTIEIPASGGVSANNDTEGYGWISGVATGVLPFRGPIIGFRSAALNDALCDGGDNLDVNTVQWLGTACATPTVAGVPEVDLTHVAGATTNVAALATNVDAILTDTGTTLDTKLNNIQGATFDTATDSLEAIRNRGDAAWVTATGFSTHSAADVWAVGTRALTDKSGFALTQAFPANFSSLSITVGGKVSIDLTNTLTAFTGVPGVAPTINDALYFQVQSIRNKKTYNKTTDVLILKEDDGTTTKMSHTMTDNATEATRGHGA